MSLWSPQPDGGPEGGSEEGGLPGRKPLGEAGRQTPPPAEQTSRAALPGPEDRLSRLRGAGPSSHPTQTCVRRGRLLEVHSAHPGPPGSLTGPGPGHGHGSPGTKPGPRALPGPSQGPRPLTMECMGTVLVTADTCRPDFPASLSGGEGPGREWWATSAPQPCPPLAPSSHGYCPSPVLPYCPSHCATTEGPHHQGHTGIPGAADGVAGRTALGCFTR